MKLNPRTSPLIVALDVPDQSAAEHLVAKLGDLVSFYKVGLELFASGTGVQLVKELSEHSKQVFADFKLFDIPATVGRAAARIADTGATYLSVHGQDAMLAAAVEHSGNTKVLAVTVLTSLDQSDLRDLGFNCDFTSLAVARARRAWALGCAGVVCSVLEVAAIRAEIGAEAVIVTPGIRELGQAVADQARSAGIAKALQAGANHVVVGRAIRDASSPRAAAAALLKQVAAEWAAPDPSPRHKTGGT